MPRTDRELMVAFQEGDAEAFAALYQRHLRPILNFFYKMSYDRGLAEDLAQETFLRLLKTRSRYRPEASFRTYLYTVARNLFIDRYRSLRAAPRALSADQPLAEEGATLGDQIPSREPDPLQQVQDREAAQWARRAMEGLPAAQREVFVLAEGQGLKYREIATILSIPVGTVKSRMHAAVIRLRGLLGRKLA